MANLIFQHETRKELRYSIDEDDTDTIEAVKLEGYELLTQEPKEVEHEVESPAEEDTQDDEVEEVETPAEEDTKPKKTTTRKRPKKVIK